MLEVDRYSGYKAMTPVKTGLLLLAFCWAHVRRDFVGVGKSWTELTPWALEWLRRIRHVYHVNRERLQHPLDTAEFQEQDALLRRAVEAMRVEAVAELSDPKLRQPCRKVLESLQEHWAGLFGSSMIRAFRWTTTLRNERVAVRPWRERTTTARDPFGVAGWQRRCFRCWPHCALENQSTIVADVVLGELCGGRREIA